MSDSSSLSHGINKKKSSVSYLVRLPSKIKKQYAIAAPDLKIELGNGVPEEFKKVIEQLIALFIHLFTTNGMGMPTISTTTVTTGTPTVTPSPTPTPRVSSYFPKLPKRPCGRGVLKNTPCQVPATKTPSSGVTGTPAPGGTDAPTPVPTTIVGGGSSGGSCCSVGVEVGAGDVGHRCNQNPDGSFNPTRHGWYGTCCCVGNDCSLGGRKPRCIIKGILSQCAPEGSCGL